ncbi:MAG: TSUP family transporter [Promethearchaeia archaeon]
MEILLFFIIFIASFLVAFIDSSYKMGYGILTPILLILGYGIYAIIPILLLVQLLSGLSKIIFHQIYAGEGYEEAEDVSLRLTSWYLIAGIIGIIFGISFISLIPEGIIIFYISIMLVVIGIISIIDIQIQFNKERLAFVSAIGSFNQTISGAGYGPLMSYEEFLHRGKSERIKIVTTFSESMISGLAFLLFYAFIGRAIFADLQLILTILVAGLMATPMGSLTMEHINMKKGKSIVAVIYIFLGSLLLILLLLNYL